MRPRIRRLAPDVWMVRERACFTTRSALNEEHPNWSFDCYRFAEAKSDSQLLCHPKRGEGRSTCQRNFMLETSLSKPPVKSFRICLLRPARLNQRVWSKIA